MELLEKASQHTIVSYLDMLTSRKNINIASGSFGVVLIPKHKQYVYKIWVDDVGYDHWVDICRANQHNPHIPKLLSQPKQLVCNFASGEFIAKMIKIEYLQPYSNQTLLCSDEYGRSTAVAFHKLCEYILLNGKQDFLLKYKNFSKEDEQTISDIVEVLSQIEIQPTMKVDIDPKNILMRGKVAVIADPVGANDTTFDMDDELYNNSVKQNISLEQILNLKNEKTKLLALRNKKWTPAQLDIILASDNLPPISKRIIAKANNLL